MSATKKKRARPCAEERREIIGALRSRVDALMAAAATYGLTAVEVTTAVEEAAINWQYDRKRKPRAVKKKRGADAQCATCGHLVALHHPSGGCSVDVMAGAPPCPCAS